MVIGAAPAPAPELEPLRHLPDRPLTAAELDALVGELTHRPEIAAAGAALSPAAGDRRWAHVHRDAHLDVWVIAWTAGSDTGWHDHDASAGAFSVMAGQVTERRPRLDGTHRVRTFASGGASFGPEHVHRISGDAPLSVSVHAYSPPLRRMGHYELGDDGTLRRLLVTYDDEP